VRTFNTLTKGYRALLLVGCAGTFAVAAPAYAQDRAPAADCGPNSTDPACIQTGGGAIVVTGSRIARPDFESTSPVVSVSGEFLKNSATSALETKLNNLPQFTPAKTPTGINAGDIQPTATNTPGSATLSLRGLGSNRNLVLIDGRRGTPANASGAVDITTIPTIAIERVELISGGASATYGADAVAGVTNFILKKNTQGLELDGQAGISQEGDGFEFTVGGLMGADFDDGRGNVSLAMSMNKRNVIFQRDRDWYRDLWADKDVAASGFFTQFPGVLFDGPGSNPAFGANPTHGLNVLFPNSTFNPTGQTTVFIDQNGNPFVNGTYDPDGPGPAFNANLEGYTGPIDGYTWKQTNVGTLGQNDTYLYLQLPLTRYNFLARGNYEINDWIGVFAQGTFSHVSTHTIQEPGPIFAGWGASINPANLDHDQLPQGLWDLLATRDNPDAPFAINALLPDPRETYTDVTTYNIIAGLEGSIPSTDWTWDMSVNRGVSATYAKQVGVYSLSRLRAVLAAPNFGEGFHATGNAEQFGFGASSATCTSGLNFFIPPAGGFSEDCLDAVHADLKNRGETTQTIVEANTQGKLFALPAGDLQVALGASYRELRYQFDNDTLTTQGRSFQDQALGIYPSGNVDKGFNVKEVYGELLVPVLSDIPGIQQLDLELGGRISDYSTTGTSYTYKALADWTVTDWLRFRGGYNRAERAPNIAELYLAPQQTFAVTTVGDLCSLANPFAFSAGPNNPNAANVRATCEALMDATGDLSAKVNYYGAPQSNATFGFAFPSLVGNPTLEPEKANTWTAGVVINSPVSSGLLSRLRLAIDYYNIKVSNAIGAQSVDIALRQCFDESLNPLVGSDPTAAAATQFCKNVPRNSVNGGLGNVTTTFVNNGRFQTDGIDAQLDWSTEVGPGTFGINSNFTYLLHFKSAELPTDPLIDYAGTQGPTQNGLDGGAYRWKLLTSFNYAVGPFTATLQWNHLPSIEDQNQVRIPGGTTDVGNPGSYDLFSLFTTFTATDNLNLRFGVENLLNQEPDLINYNPANTNPGGTGNLRGGALGGDTIGRRFFAGANVKF
jgi:outer membrane receptor protein involved in Fe transport